MSKQTDRVKVLRPTPHKIRRSFRGRSSKNTKSIINSYFQIQFSWQTGGRGPHNPEIHVATPVKYFIFQVHSDSDRRRSSAVTVGSLTVAWGRIPPYFHRVRPFPQPNYRLAGRTYYYYDHKPYELQYFRFQCSEGKWSDSVYIICT